MRLLPAFCATACMLLSGCYHQPIQQGNILSASKTAKVRRGMSKQQVLEVMGAPVMQNIYQDNRLVYVYTLEPSRGHIHKQRFVVTFKNGRVVQTS